MAVAVAARAAEFDDHPYAWVITRDRDAELRGNADSAVGVAGPSKATDAMLQRVWRQGRRFRLCDEGDLDEATSLDGVPVDPAERRVVYEGLIWSADPPGAEADFGPLGDFGAPNFGCVDIQYQDGDHWVTL